MVEAMGYYINNQYLPENPKSILAPFMLVDIFNHKIFHK